MPKKTGHSPLGRTIIDGLREFRDALQNDEAICERFTCREVVLNLQPSQYKAADVKEVRQLLGASQAIFARFLGVSAKAVQAWEAGDKAPSDIAARFMDEIRWNPEYWKGRLRDVATVRKVSS